jgi:hypothetical protein
MEMNMKRIIGTALIALAMTGTASAGDSYSNGSYVNNGYNAPEKQDYEVKKPQQRADYKVYTDKNPTKLKKQLQFFEQFSQRD